MAKDKGTLCMHFPVSALAVAPPIGHAGTASQSDSDMGTVTPFTYRTTSV